MKFKNFAVSIVTALLFSGTIFAQIIIQFDQDAEATFKERIIVVPPGDSIQFVTSNGDFAIYDYQAILYLDIDINNLTVLITDESPESPVFHIRKLKNDDYEFIFYCISNGKWPEAPPKIIIRTQE